jgi:hypothetical protein
MNSTVSSCGLGPELYTMEANWYIEIYISYYFNQKYDETWKGFLQLQEQNHEAISRQKQPLLFS